MEVAITARDRQAETGGQRIRDREGEKEIDREKERDRKE